MKGEQIELPPGFRFHPTDEELVMHYLCQKCASQQIAVPIIAEIDLYKFDPWQLPGNFFLPFLCLNFGRELIGVYQTKLHFWEMIGGDFDLVELQLETNDFLIL